MRLPSAEKGPVLHVYDRDAQLFERYRNGNKIRSRILGHSEGACMDLTERQSRLRPGAPIWEEEGVAALPVP